MPDWMTTGRNAVITGRPNLGTKTGLTKTDTLDAPFPLARSAANLL